MTQLSRLAWSNSGRPADRRPCPEGRGACSRDFGRLVRPLPHRRAVSSGGGPVPISVGPPGRIRLVQPDVPWAAWRVAPWSVPSELGRGPPAATWSRRPVFAPSVGCEIDPFSYHLRPFPHQRRLLTTSKAQGTASGVRRQQVPQGSLSLVAGRFSIRLDQLKGGSYELSSRSHVRVSSRVGVRPDEALADAS